MSLRSNTFEKSRVPLYLQVARLMRQKVERQEWPVGAQIPTLNALEEEFQVSRITLRESLAQLEAEGLIRRERGRGTFVEKDLSAERWYKLPTHFDALVRTVSELQIRLLAIDQDDQPLAARFREGQVAPAYRRLRRVHYHQDKPYCVIEIWIASDVFALDPAGFSEAPVIPLLAALAGVRIGQARQVVHVTVADQETADLLDIGVGEPVADVCRVVRDDSGRLIHCAQIQYPAQLIQIEMDLMAATPRPSTAVSRAATAGRTPLPK